MILKFEVKPVKEVATEEEEEEDEEMEVEEVDSDEWEEDDPIPVTECLFCNHHSNNLDKNLNHMTIEHSFFLPDPEFLVNLEGLIEYLGAKVCIKMDYFHHCLLTTRWDKDTCVCGATNVERGLKPRKMCSATWWVIFSRTIKIFLPK